MAQEFSAYIGVETGTGRKPFTYVCLTASRKVLALGSGGVVDVLSFAAGQANALVAISPPLRPGSLKSSQPGEPALPVLRLGGLHQVRLDGSSQLFSETSAASPAWMTACVELVSRLQSMDYQPFPAEAGSRQWLEAPAQSGFHAWLGSEPFEAGTLEGRLQRQLILYDLDLDVPDAMDFFEEITRFKLLHGHLPFEKVLDQAEINATMAANTAWLAANKPNSVCGAGSPETGLVYYPLKQP